MPYASSSSARSVNGDWATNGAATGTVTATPSTHSIPASAGPAPPRRDSNGSCTCKPKLCRSASRPASCGVSGEASAESVAIERLEVGVEHAVLEVFAHRHTFDLVELTPEVAPRLVRREQDAVRTDTAAFDLGEQPSRPESHRPRRVGVDAVALLDPVKELRDQLDMATDAAAEVDQVDLDPLAVFLDERDEVVEIGRAAGAGVEVEDEIVRLGSGEAGLGDLGGRRVTRTRVGRPPEEEGSLQRHDAALAGVLECLEGELAVLWAE